MKPYVYHMKTINFTKNKIEHKTKSDYKKVIVKLRTEI